MNNFTRRERCVGSYSSNNAVAVVAVSVVLLVSGKGGGWVFSLGGGEREESDEGIH